MVGNTFLLFKSANLYQFLFKTPDTRLKYGIVRSLTCTVGILEVERAGIKSESGHTKRCYKL